MSVIRFIYVLYYNTYARTHFHQLARDNQRQKFTLWCLCRACSSSSELIKICISVCASCVIVSCVPNYVFRALGVCVCRVWPVFACEYVWKIRKLSLFIWMVVFTFRIPYAIRYPHCAYAISFGLSLHLPSVSLLCFTLVL